MSGSYYLAMFKSKNQSIYILSILEGLGYNNFQIVSTPCTISVGCNYAIKFINGRYYDVLLREALKANIGEPIVYMAEYQKGKMVYKRVNL